MKVYLAGGMKDGWQDYFLDACPNVQFFDPRKTGLTDPADYTKWDLEHVSKADVVLACMDSTNPSGYGLSVEIGYAKALGKRVIFIDNVTDWRSRYFDMHRQVADFCTGSFERAAEWILELASGCPKCGGEMAHHEATPALPECHSCADCGYVE